MSIFTICTAFVTEGKLEKTIKELVSSEKNFTLEIGVLFRRFFKCVTQPHIIWSITEWISEKHHNNAAQSLMKKRRDDRIASIRFGPDPYFEIFCDEDKEIKIGNFSDDLNFIIISHGIINYKARESYLKLRKDRTTEIMKNLCWLRIYHNRYSPDEFVAFLGFLDERSYNQVRSIGDFLLEEYLFTGLTNSMEMSQIASYNQFICTPISIS
jgi:hypothetical protein